LSLGKPRRRKGDRIADLFEGVRRRRLTEGSGKTAAEAESNTLKKVSPASYNKNCVKASNEGMHASHARFPKRSEARLPNLHAPRPKPTHHPA